MSKFMFHGSYKKSGLEGLLKEGGSSRRAAIKQLVESLGGSLESFYYTYGNKDVVAIADLPDASTAAALSLMINASGTVGVTCEPLITPEEIDAAAKKTVNYRPPGA